MKNEPPLELPKLPEQLLDTTLTLGTDPADCAAFDDDDEKTEEKEEFRIAAMRKREELEDSECGYELQEIQKVL